MEMTLLHLSLVQSQAAFLPSPFLLLTPSVDGEAVPITHWAWSFNSLHFVLSLYLHRLWQTLTHQNPLVTCMVVTPTSYGPRLPRCKIATPGFNGYSRLYRLVSKMSGVWITSHFGGNQAVNDSKFSPLALSTSHNKEIFLAHIAHLVLFDMGWIRTAWLSHKGDGFFKAFIL